MSKGMRNLVITLVAVSVIISCIIGWGVVNRDNSTEHGKLQVTVTTTFLGDVVRQIAGDKVDLIVLMGPGIDPHQYQASSSDLNKLLNADVIFYGGLHLESKLAEVLEKVADGGKTTINTSRTIPKEALLYAEDNGAEAEEPVYDPHIWFNIDLWRYVVTDIVAELSAHDPENKEFYEEQYANYGKELDELAEYVAESIALLPENSRHLITAHDAFNYFGVYTGMEVRGIQGISTVVEAGTSDISDLAGFIAEHQIKAVFVESTVSPKLISALTEAVQAKGFNTSIGGELFSDSTGSGGTPEGTYIGMYRHNIDTIVEALK